MGMERPQLPEAALGAAPGPQGHRGIGSRDPPRPLTPADGHVSPLQPLMRRFRSLRVKSEFRILRAQCRRRYPDGQ